MFKRATAGSGIGSRSSPLVGKRQRWSPAVEDAPRMTEAPGTIVTAFKARLYPTAEQADSETRIETQGGYHESK
jgi:hypothetical protein